MTNPNQIRRLFTYGFTTYNVLHVLGEGTFGTVYECRDTWNGENVAIKTIDHTGNQARYNYAQGEIAVLDGLRNRHNNLIYMLNYFTQGNLTCIVFPVYGPTIADAMFKYVKNFRIDEVRIIARQLISATDFLHRNQMLHSDIKPANILLNRNFYDPTKGGGYADLNIVLCDLGSVYSEDEFADYVITTLSYRAPDVIMGSLIGYPCDVWSVGCVLFELLAGEKLFEAETQVDLMMLIHLTLGPIEPEDAAEINHNLNNCDILDEAALNGVRDKVRDFTSVFSIADEEDQPILARLTQEEEIRNLHQLIRSMLNINPAQRVSLGEAINNIFL